MSIPLSLLPPAVALLARSFSPFPRLTRTPSYAGYYVYVGHGKHFKYKFNGNQNHSLSL